jgi:hypothetical protein
VFWGMLVQALVQAGISCVVNSLSDNELLWSDSSLTRMRSLVRAHLRPVCCCLSAIDGNLPVLPKVDAGHKCPQRNLQAWRQNTLLLRGDRPGLAHDPCGGVMLDEFLVCGQVMRVFHDSQFLTDLGISDRAFV